MTHTRHTDQSLSSWLELAQARVLVNAAWSWTEIRKTELFPGVTLDSEIIEVPLRWVAAGTSQSRGSRILVPAVSSLTNISNLAERSQIERNIRMALLALWLPGPRRSRQKKPITWVKTCQHYLRAVDWIIGTGRARDGYVWKFLSRSDFQDLLSSKSDQSESKKQLSFVLRHLSYYGEKGLVQDFPQLTELGEDNSENNSLRLIEESNLRPNSLKSTGSQRNFQPFSDEFTQEFIWRALWIQENLADSLIDCCREQIEIVNHYAEHGIPVNDVKVKNHRSAAISSRNWIDASGAKIKYLPFPASTLSDFGFSQSWPPTHGRGVRSMITILQGLNIGLVTFCTGARSSEISSIEDNSLKNGSGDAYLSAKTFKLEDNAEGILRDWPLHPAAAQALQSQIKLAKLFRPARAKHLWVTTTNRGGGGRPVGSALIDPTGPLQIACKLLDISHLAGSDGVHMHRWRETTARLVALSVFGAPQVLFDLFGHRDLEMTIRYMLAHPEIVSQAFAVAKEASIALSETAAREALAGLTSGPASRELADGARIYLRDINPLPQMRRGEDAFGASDYRELAEVLTLNGQEWQLVKPGVICTKAAGQFGPCTRSRGMPDPGSCRTNCTHRLELQRAKSECEAVVGHLVSEWRNARDRGAVMLERNVRGQLISQLRRWDDVAKTAFLKYPELSELKLDKVEA